MTHVVFENRYDAVSFGNQKINIHSASAPFRPHADRPAPGGFDVCLLTTTPIPDVLAHLRSHSVAVVEGPCPQTGAKGQMMSVYVNDPDGNLIEIANYNTPSARPA